MVFFHLCSSLLLLVLLNIECFSSKYLQYNQPALADQLFLKKWAKQVVEKK